MNTIISQAMATGMPVVATKHSGLPEQVLDGQTGLLAKEGDPVDLAAKLRQMLEHPEKWVEMGRLAREHILNSYDAAKLVGIQIAYYADAIRESDDKQHVKKGDS